MTRAAPVDYKAFVLGLVIVVALNGVRAIANDFESTGFASFRYEGLLFYENAVRYLREAPFLTLLFFSDFSTSADPAQHPLYYFHNLNAVHFLSGMIQHFTEYWGYVHFLISSTLFVLGARLLFRLDTGSGEKAWHYLVVALVVLSPKGFLWAPQNMFVAVILFGVAAHFALLSRIHRGGPAGRDALLMAGLLFIVAMTETNTAILLALVCILYISIGGAISLLRGCGFSAVAKRVTLVTLAAGVPIAASRVFQVVSLHLNGLLDLFFRDIAYTRELKVVGGTSLQEAIQFYGDNGLTFFGVVGNEILIDNVKYLYTYFENEYSAMFLVVVALAAVVVTVRHRDFVFGVGEASIGQSEAATPSFLPFIAAYLLCFAIAAFAILVVTGRALHNIAFSEWAIFDVAAVFRACFVVLPAMLLWRILSNWRSQSMPFAVRAGVSAVAFFALLAESGGGFADRRADPLTFKTALNAVEPGSDVITNFDIGPVAVETGSRVSISWFIDDRSACDGLKSGNLLRQFRTAPESREGSGHVYLALAYFMPYGSSRESVAERHCLDRSPHFLLYEDENFGVYRIINRTMEAKTLPVTTPSP